MRGRAQTVDTHCLHINGQVSCRLRGVDQKQEIVTAAEGTDLDKRQVGRANIGLMGANDRPRVGLEACGNTRADACRIAGKAGILGGAILIFIGIEIFVTNIF